MRERWRFLFVAVGILPLSTALGQTRRPLSSDDINAIAMLERLEDRRDFDSTTLAKLLADPHPEIRRRAALATGRINDRAGIALLRARPLDLDTAVAATVVFAVGHLRDSSTVAWFDSLLSARRTPPIVLTEAACALGKIPTSASRAALAKFLAAVKPGPRTNAAIGEALLAIGRTPRGDLAAILPWTRSPDEELRWRATWALFRPRDPAAVKPLLVLANDRSALVRSWAIRALTKAQADSAGVGAQAKARLLMAVKDRDRRVSTEAITALATYGDSAAAAAATTALRSADTWIAVTAAQAIGRLRLSETVAALLAATEANRPCAVRVNAMQSLQAFAPAEALSAANRLARDTAVYCQTTGYAAIARAAAAADSAGAPDRIALDVQLDSLRIARRAGLASLDPSRAVPAIRAMAAWGDSADLERLRGLRTVALRDSSVAVASALATTITQIERRLRGEVAPQRGRGGGGGARPALPKPDRPLAEYRAIVERWVVPAYNGAPPPRSRWITPRGTIELELYPGDAPLAVDDFVKTISSGVIVGTQFTRVVPDFVNQQEPIRPGNVLRDEVNRHRLTRANLSWASAGLDTGNPGYTLNHTPQPHNEGNFTSLGRVVGGMDVVDRIELGDRILSATMILPKTPPR